MGSVEAVPESSSRCMQVINSSTLDSQLLHISKGYLPAARLVLAISAARFWLYSSGTQIAYQSEDAFSPDREELNEILRSRSFSMQGSVVARGTLGA